MNKKGFSIPEILIVLTIVAIAAVAFMTTLKPNNIVLKKLYYNAYRTLSSAAYNIMADVEDYNQKLYDEAAENGTDEPDESELHVYPKTAAELCEKLVSADKGYINVLGTPTCSTSADPQSTSQFEGKTYDQLTAEASFVASNGMLFFLAQMNDVGDTLVWVDLNGNRKPNSAVWKSSRPADIVPFMILHNGAVLPLGAPTYDINYLTARVVYADPDLKPSDENSRYFKSMSYAGAKQSAFGGVVYPKDPLSRLDPTDGSTDFTKLITLPSRSDKCPDIDDKDNEYPSCSVEVYNPL